jgi:hypothetical protein
MFNSIITCVEIGKTRKNVFLGFGILGLFVSAVQASSISITPTSDTFVISSGSCISDASPDRDYGNGGALHVAGINSSDPSKGEFKSLLRFDTSSVQSEFDDLYGQGNWTIESISLTLTLSTWPSNMIFNGPCTNGDFSILLMSDDRWIEGDGTPNVVSNSGVTWNTLPNYLDGNEPILGTYTYTNLYPSGNPKSFVETYALAVQPGIVNDLMSDDELSLLFIPVDESVGFSFTGRLTTKIADRPTLTITAIEVPEPSIISLLILGNLWLRSTRISPKKH